MKTKISILRNLTTTTAMLAVEYDGGKTVWTRDLTGRYEVEARCEIANWRPEWTITGELPLQVSCAVDRLFYDASRLGRNLSESTSLDSAEMADELDYIDSAAMTMK